VRPGREGRGPASAGAREEPLGLVVASLEAEELGVPLARLAEPAVALEVRSSRISRARRERRNFQNLTTFDGHGNLTTPTGVDTVGGLIERDTPTVGTYAVNPDCTGELVLVSDHAPEFGGTHVHHIFITVVGRKFYFTVADPGATGSGFGERIRHAHD
jgi:hypothetical protein